MNRIGIRRKPHILWDPTKLSDGTLYGWFDASRLDTFTFVDDSGVKRVSSWASIGQAGRTFAQSNSSRRPFHRISPYNGRPCVTFYHSNSDTAGDYLDGTTTGGFDDINARLHMFAACRQTGTTIREATGDSTENFMGIVIYEGYPSGLFLSSNSSGYQTGIGCEWWTSANGQLPNSMTFSSSPHLKLTCFGESVNGGTSGNYTTTLHARNYIPPRTSGTSSTGRKNYAASVFRLGCALQGGGLYAYPLHGEIYEVILLTGTIATQTKIKMLEYLSARWGP